MKFYVAVKKIIELIRTLPVDKDNYLNYIRQHEGPFAADLTFQFGKIQLKLNKTHMDLSFLKKCKKNNVLPSFVKFRISETYNRHQTLINDCYQRILINEIKLKKKNLSFYHRYSNRLITQMLNILDPIVYTRTRSIIERLIFQKRTEWGIIHEKKFNQIHKRHDEQKIITKTNQHFPKSPVHNLSRRQLTDEEITVLSNGMNFVSPNKSIDDETFICNMENLFKNILGKVTDTNDYDMKEEHEQVEYKMTKEQLQTVNKIRSTCDRFTVAATKSLKKISKQQKINKVLNNLAKDKNIYITKADKGNAVVILNRDEYIKKMETIVNDPKTFQLLVEDPTLKQEDKLIRKLKSLVEIGFMTQEDYDECKPSGSQPARIYALPKIHKAGAPLRPILSSIGTFNYRLAKWLVKRLSHLRNHETIINDTFSFVDDLHTLNIDMNQHKLLSYDAINLFTNVPLLKTINFILQAEYGDHCECKSENKKNKTNKCHTCTNKEHLRWLLHIATAETHFHFNGNIYLQHEGVSMGSPLGPLIADIFLIHLEKKLMNELEMNGIVYYRRFVDDTFVIARNDADEKKIQSIMNKFDKSVQFTYEQEQPLDRSISFLDVTVICQRTKSTSWFKTKIYRKDTFTGLITKYTSFVPHEYKRSAISAMAYRAIRICSDYITMNEEFGFIKEIALANDYPSWFVDTVIGQTLNRYIEKSGKTSTIQQSDKLTTPTTTPDPKEKLKHSPLLVDIPFAGRPTTTLGRQLISIVKKVRPDITLQPIPRPFPTIQCLFPRKEMLDKNLQANIVYKIDCNECPATYIGKTWRQATRRHVEHGATATTIRSLRKPEPSSSFITKASETNVDNVRRSARTVNRIVDYKQLNDPFKKDEMIIEEEQMRNVKNSALWEHHETTGHCIDWINWKIISKDQRRFRLLIRESIAIMKYEPDLNRMVQSVPLVIFPNGRTKTTRFKMKPEQKRNATGR